MNPHAASGTGTPRNPYLYNSMESYQRGLLLDPTAWHGLTEEARKAVATARQEVTDAWAPAFNEAVLKVLKGELVPKPPSE